MFILVLLSLDIVYHLTIQRVFITLFFCMKKETEKLNPKQEAFCQLYVSGDKDFFGNWVQSYIEVYEPDQSKPWWYKVACSSASRLLSNEKVFNRINDLLEEHWLNDQFVDKQLLYLIKQHADNSSKISAIREYNKLKQRIVSRQEIEVKWSSVKDLTFDEDIQ